MDVMWERVALLGHTLPHHIQEKPHRRRLVQTSRVVPGREMLTGLLAGGVDTLGAARNIQACYVRQR